MFATSWTFVSDQGIDRILDESLAKTLLCYCLLLLEALALKRLKSDPAALDAAYDQTQARLKLPLIKLKCTPVLKLSL